MAMKTEFESTMENETDQSKFDSGNQKICPVENSE